MAYEYITRYDSPNYNRGGNTPQEIVIHHWGATGQKFQNVVNWLCNPAARVSAHYVVESGRVACLVNLSDRAWHAGNAWHNAHSIGIECRPEATEGDYRTVAELVAKLWKTYGKLKLIRHKDIVATSCPGKWDIAKIKRMAEEFYSGGKPSGGGADKPVSTSGSLVKVAIKDLYIRTGPGKNYANKGFIKPGVYTIVETQGRWGKLKSGAGWICLDYAVRL